MTDHPPPYRVLVTGSRDWSRGDLVRLALEIAFCEAVSNGRLTTVVHGACPDGADAPAVDWANYMISRGMPVKVEPHPADWRAHGRAAGPRRNAEMVAVGADEALAFIGPCTSTRCRCPGPHGSHGATGCARLAEQAGIPTKRWTL